MLYYYSDKMYNRGIANKKGRSIVFLETLPDKHSPKKRKQNQTTKKPQKKKMIPEHNLEDKFMIDNMHQIIKEQAIINKRLKDKVLQLKSANFNLNCECDDKNKIKEKRRKWEMKIFCLEEKVKKLKEKKKKKTPAEKDAEILQLKKELRKYRKAFQSKQSDKTSNSALPQTKESNTHAKATQTSMKYFIRAESSTASTQTINPTFKEIETQTKSLCHDVFAQTERPIFNDFSTQTSNTMAHEASRTENPPPKSCSTKTVNSIVHEVVVQTLNVSANHTMNSSHIVSPNKSRVNLLHFEEHNYSSAQLVRPTSNSAIKTQFKCERCGRNFKKRDSSNVHQKESKKCSNGEIIKNAECPVCFDKFTYNGLRSHLRQFTKDNGTRNVRGEHSKRTAQEHQTILNEIKMNYKSEKSF